jgi:eukaryotic-like serine/threonine-protein kinase
VLLLVAITSCPIFPIVGFHLEQARRQFRAGHSLADLRSALDIAKREQAETDAIVREDEESPARRALRAATIGAAGWLGITVGLMISGAIHENRTALIVFLAPLGSTMLLGAISNALDVQFIPTGIRKFWQTGIRERLWNSRVGEWFARKLGAPERSTVAGELAFRPTESALSIAASELFALLPETYRDRLFELPATIEALEAHAAEARADLEIIASLVPSESDDASILDARRDAARAHLAKSVAALETIRIDLLRLHGNAHDLAPLTTLLDAARVAGEEVSMLADAQQEVEDATHRNHGARRIPTLT